jgi:hypothetical protein
VLYFQSTFFFIVLPLLYPSLSLSADVSEGERKYLGDQVRTLQIKCDLLKKQNEQQKQLHLEAREEEDERRAREREEDDGLNKVG